MSNIRSKYKTKQRDILLDYLKTVKGEHITAGDVYEHFRQMNAPIAKATIYRQLEKLVGEGILKKYIIDPNTPACFEYVSEEEHKDSDMCFHCKCEKCGKLIHLSCKELEEIQSHMYKTHHFRVDHQRTVFYGLCDKCIE